MENVLIDTQKLPKEKLITENQNTGTMVYNYDENYILKLFNPLYIAVCLIQGIDIKSKILKVDSLNKEKLEKLVLPEAIALDKNRNQSFCGYITPKIEGIDYPTYTVDNLFRYDLYYYANMHSQFENIIKRGNEQGIIFPDLCSWQNILVTIDGDIRFIDYDDFQIGNLKTNCYSTALGTKDMLDTLGIMDSNGLFNTNVDKLSLIYLYFLDALRVDLSKIIYSRDIAMSLDNLFYKIGLDDVDIQEKICKLFQRNKENEFLGNDLYRIAEMYKIDEYYDKNKVLSRRFKRR